MRVYLALAQTHTHTHTRTNAQTQLCSPQDEEVSSHHYHKIDSLLRLTHTLSLTLSSLSGNRYPDGHGGLQIQKD